MLGGRQKNKQYHPESENWDQEDNGGGSDDGFDDKEEAKKKRNDIQNLKIGIRRIIVVEVMMVLMTRRTPKE